MQDKTETTRAAHLAFLDPIRIGLTALVIVHHTSIGYGGSGSWYYVEQGAPSWLGILLSMFNGVNQSFFMGFFFLIAGYLMPASIARKGELAYLGDRLIRLWVPLLFFGFLLDPLTRALADGAAGGEVVASYLERIGRNSFGQGPLWFNQLLLVFALIWTYASARRWPRIDWHWPATLHVSIALAIIACGALAFCLRLLVPTGHNVFGVQIGYCASYLILFFGGARLARKRWLERVEWRHAAPWLAVSVLTMPTLWIAAIGRGLIGSTLWQGGWNSAALHYAFWEPLVAAGIIMSSLALARRWYVRERKCITTLARASYAAFVVHAPIVVACSWLVKDWSAAFGVRFVLAASLSCVLAFAVGVAVNRALGGTPRRDPPTVVA